MKKILLTTALAVAALSAQAKDFDFGYSAMNTVGSEGAYTQRPISLDLPTSGSQTLYTYDELHDLYKVGTDGSITKAAITEVTFLLTGGTDNYCFSGENFDVTVYVENTPETSFPLNSNNKPVFFEYSKAITGQAHVDESYSDEWADFFYGGYETYDTGLPVTIKLNEPIVYEGGSLLFTWVSQTDGMEDLYYSGDCFGVDPKNGVKTLFVRNDNISGEGYSDTYLPALKLTYEEQVEAPAGPEIVRGEAADFEVGNFDNPSIETGSTGDFLPFDGAYLNSVSQALYTNVELNGLNKISDGEVTKAEIQDITFLVSAEDGMYFFGGEYFDTTVYVQNTDATELPQDANGTYKWFDYSEEYKGSVSVDFSGEEWEDFTYGMGGLYPVTIHLDTPIMYEGQSLLLTFITESECGDETWVNATAAVATGGKQAANKSSDRESASEMLAGDPKNTWRHVPVLKLHYVPVTEKGGATVTAVSFENVEVSLVEVNSAVGSYEKGNTIAVSFDLNDASNCGSYEIKAGTTSLGTINSTTGSISFLNLPVGDAITLNVVPAGEGTIGVPYEIKKADIEALFPEPEMEVAATAFADSEYELISLPESFTMDGAAQFFFKNYQDVPVSQFNWLDIMNPGDKDVYYLRSGFGELLTKDYNNPKNVQSNEGRISFSKPNAVTATTDASTGVVKETFKGSLYVNFAVDYPLYYGVTPVLTEGSNASTNVASVDEVKATTIQKKYDNGSPYNYNKNQLSADFSAITHPGAIEAVHPDNLTWNWVSGSKTITIVGPKGSTLYYKKGDAYVAAAVTDEDGFIKHENELPYLVLNTDDYDNATLHVQARTNDGDVHSEIYLGVNDGVVAGVDNVLVDTDNTAEYYNLQGVRVNGALTPGLYIVRQGGKTTKVIVK